MNASKICSKTLAVNKVRKIGKRKIWTGSHLVSTDPCCQSAVCVKFIREYVSRRIMAIKTVIARRDWMKNDRQTPFRIWAGVKVAGSS